jgi:TRAP-type C4-dicarboxylate transport system permease small subunit
MVRDTSLPAIRERLDDAVERSMGVYEWVCILFFFLMLVVALIQIGNRLIPVDHPFELRWTVAWSVRLMLFTAFLGIGLIHYHDDDISISAFKEWLQGRVRPALGALYQFALDVVVLGVLAFLVYATATFTMETLDVAPAPNFFPWFKQGHLILFLTLGLTVAFLYRLVHTLDTLYRVLGPVLGPRLSGVWRKLWR